MPEFRQRPLSWLFVIATACLDLVAVAKPEVPWVDVIAVGQIIVVSSWLILGHSHRLARSGVFMGLLGLLAAPDFATEQGGAGLGASTGPYVLGSILAIAAATTGLVAIWRLLGRAILGAATESAKKRWQFPVAEIFGWMTIVAVASVGLQAAHFGHVADSLRELLLGIAYLAAITGVVTLSLGDFRRFHWPKGIMESAWLILIVLTFLFMPTGDPDADFCVCVYVGLWTLTQKLDEQHRAPAAQASVAS